MEYILECIVAVIGFFGTVAAMLFKFVIDTVCSLIV